MSKPSPNYAVERTAASHPLAATAHRDRWTAANLWSKSTIMADRRATTGMSFSSFDDQD
jgi:hypothetical protein